MVDGMRPRHVWVDEATRNVQLGERAQHAVRRQMADDWDVTSAGVLLQPIPLGTTVEAFDMQRDQVTIGEVVRREKRSDATGSWITIYRVRCEWGEVGVGRDHLSVFDRSPEGIERWLDDDRPRTPEEIERWLGDA